MRFGWMHVGKAPATMRRRTDSPPHPVTGILTTSGRQNGRRGRRHAGPMSGRGTLIAAAVLLAVLATVVAATLAA